MVVYVYVYAHINHALYIEDAVGIYTAAAPLTSSTTCNACLRASTTHVCVCCTANIVRGR